MNIVRFEMDVPAQLALQSSQGTRIEGRYGDRMMFSLTDGRVMYVPPIVAAKIEAEGITAGECFQLCKTQIRTGQRRTVEWQLKRIDSEQHLEQPLDLSAQPEAPETKLESELK